MIAAPDRADLERFRAAISSRLGLCFDDTKLGFLAERLQRRLDDGGTTTAHYLDELEQKHSRGELRALASELTVSETYFFRNLDQLRAFVEVALADCLATPERRLRILSAGCASGEEPYSLAMLVREHAHGVGFDVSILAVDINPVMLERAPHGRYSAWSLRETSVERQQRWFRPDGRDLVLDPTIRAAVQFEERNLAREDAELWQPDAYDVVFCRNVLMYFTAEQARAAVARITRSLRPGGYLFLGHAETLRGLSSDYHLRNTHETFYYQRKGAERPCDEPAQASAQATARAELGWTSTWIDVVQRSTDRIRTLAAQPPLASEPKAALLTPAADLSVAIALLQEERYAEALQLLHRLPPESARNPDALLLRAALLTHCGELTLAEKACAELLELDELNAGSHYLLALCREAVGDRQGAMSHHRMASHLDPAFVMPCLYLGLMARRAGDRDTARKELGKALSLLPREDSSRLLLFAGGFRRDALIELCRAELDGLEGTP